MSPVRYEAPDRGFSCPVFKEGTRDVRPRIPGLVSKSKPETLHQASQTHGSHLPMRPLASSTSAARLNALRTASRPSPLELPPLAQYSRHKFSVTHALPAGIWGEADGTSPAAVIASPSRSRARCWAGLSFFFRDVSGPPGASRCSTTQELIGFPWRSKP